MKRIFAIFRRDIMHVRSNAIALLVCMGLVIMPSLYAWFNIAGGWDPYANTGQVKVALANSDEGVEGSIVPFSVNVGERVVRSLSGSDKIDYVVTSEDKAVEGVRSGEYYAAVVIPKTFSKNLLSVLTNHPTHPELDYYVNEKRNAIASIVTGKASGSVQNMVDTGFTEAVTEVATQLFDEVSWVMDDSNVSTVATGLSGTLDETLGAIDRSAADILAYRDVVTSIRGVMESSASIVGNGSTSLNVAGSLSDAADGVRQLDGVAQNAKESAESAIDRGKSAVDDVQAALDEAFSTADAKTDEVTDALNRANDAAKVRRDRLTDFRNKLEDLSTQARVHEKSFKDITVVNTLQVDLSDMVNRCDVAISQLNDLISTVDQTISDIQTTKSNGQSSRQELQGLAQRAADEVESVRNGFQDKLSGSLEHVAGVIDDAAATTTEISDTLKSETGKIGPAITSAADGLQNLENSLTEASTKLGDITSKLRGLRDKLNGATSSGDLDMVRTIMGGDAASLVSFLASPVQLDREAIYPVENNGSAMTPYYTTMALWVGGTLMGVLLYTAVSKRAEEETGARPRHTYFGRLAFFLLLGACQSTILLLGDVFFLGVQCQNPLLFLVTGWIASTVFINIIYSLATSFGDIGKAVAVFIMVVQVAGSGGTFPVQMLPKPFQIAYPFLPFVHSENAMRAAMFGVNGNDWVTEICLLALFLVPALVLGLLLRKPFVPVNEWIEEKMEETKLM